MSTLVEIECAIRKLSATELAQLVRVVRHELESRRDMPIGDAPPQPRVFGLHHGAWSVTDDFDAPLPDEFWLGRDA